MQTFPSNQLLCDIINIKRWKFDLLLISWKCACKHILFHSSTVVLLRLVMYDMAAGTFRFDSWNSWTFKRNSLSPGEQVLFETGSNRIKIQKKTLIETHKTKTNVKSRILPLAKRFNDNLNRSLLIYNRMYPLTPGQKIKRFELHTRV